MRVWDCFRKVGTRQEPEDLVGDGFGVGLLVVVVGDGLGFTVGMILGVVTTGVGVAFFAAGLVEE